MHFNYDFNLVFYLAVCIFFLYQFISRRKAKPSTKAQRIALLKKSLKKGVILLPRSLALQNELIKFPLKQGVDIMDSRPLKRKGWIKRIIQWPRRLKWLLK